MCWRLSPLAFSRAGRDMLRASISSLMNLPSACIADFRWSLCRAAARPQHAKPRTKSSTAGVCPLPVPGNDLRLTAKSPPLTQRQVAARSTGGNN